ncbi:hypothetical protein K437DRAFT_259395 [Acetobacter orientalis]|uniref:Uncharacterized protein n=1 Tax=Acetobacter orientalis TaxID=146474 RepID=A0A2Z5ZG86_9PROT|nr:hypothetical protein K437DRAFT_259395 [Acetobacter orientalis]
MCIAYPQLQNFESEGEVRRVFQKYLGLFSSFALKCIVVCVDAVVP